MPFILALVGLILIISAVQGTLGALGAELKDDFTGPGNFFFWIVAIGAIGALGYYGPLKPVSRSLLVLVILALVLSNRGVFTKGVAALNSGPIAPVKDTPAANDNASGAAGTAGISIMDVAGSFSATAQDASATRREKSAENFGTSLKVALKLFGL